jgi:hypothetical protein
VDGKSDRSNRLWTAIWAPAKPELFDRAANYVFWVEPPGGSAFCSEAFQLGGPVTRVPMPPRKAAVDCPPWSHK